MSDRQVFELSQHDLLLFDERAWYALNAKAEKGLNRSTEISPKVFFGYVMDRMHEVSERLHGSCIGPMCQYRTIFGHQGPEHCRQSETRSPDAYESIPAVIRRLYVGERAREG